MTDPKQIKDMIEACGGTVTGGGVVDDHGFMTASFPLPVDHWIYQEQIAPPMPFRRGVGPERDEWAKRIVDAARYAVRAATVTGKEMDFDPDALVQNMVVGMLGYWTETGMSADDWANPKNMWVDLDTQTKETEARKLLGGGVMPKEMKARYRPKTTAQKLGYLVEECGEVLAAVGKTQRWGLDSCNPESRAAFPRTNRDWILSELLDLERAIGFVREALKEK